MKKVFLCVVVGLLLLAIHTREAPATVKTCSDNVSDDFNNSSLNTKKWTIHKGRGKVGNATIVNNQLVLTYPNESGVESSVNIYTASEISGNFDIYIDLINKSKSSDSDAGVRLMIIDTYWINRISVDRDPTNHYIRSYYYLGDGPPHGEKIGFSSSTGFVTIRVTRDGSDFKTYFKENNHYTLLGDYPNVINGNVLIRLSASSHESQFPYVTGVFDNFVLKCFPSATPSITPSIPASGS